VAASYDSRKLRLYVNGTLMAEEEACFNPEEEGGCGDVVYPSTTDPRAQGATPFIVGGYDNKQTGISVSHQGLIGSVRMFGKALRDEVISAAFVLLIQALPEERCQPGEYGAYQGISPCFPCPLGTYSPSPAMDRCMLCPRGFYADEVGLRACKSCPFAVTTPQTTPSEGSESADLCEEPNECVPWSELQNDCNVHATCIKTVGSFECHCNTGYEGSGVDCSPICGDGLRVLGEECDDGNEFPLDGCGETCKVEDGWSCDPKDPSVMNSTSQCTCHLDVELCCYRYYVSCMREDGRFGDEGLDEDGADKILSGDLQEVLATNGQSCSDACAALGEGSSCQNQIVQQEADNLMLAGQTCERLATFQSPEGVSSLLGDPAALPMVDEFGVDGEGSVVRSEGMGAGTPAGRTCYVWPAGGSTPENSCDAKPTLATGLRVCHCRGPPNYCSRNCLAEQGKCLAKDPQLAERRQQAAVEYKPCLDNPNFRGEVDNVNPATSAGRKSFHIGSISDYSACFRR